MQRTSLFALGALAAFAFTPFTASASTAIFGAAQTPNLDCSTAADAPGSQGCPDLTSGTGQGVFSLLSAGEITEVQFWTYEEASAYKGGTLDWAIYVDVGGAQGSLEGQGSFNMLGRLPGTDVNVAGLALTEYQNSFSFSSLSVGGSPQAYFLDLWEPQPPTDGSGIFWARSSDTAMAFELFGTLNNSPTPEPGTFALLAGGILLGFAGMCVRRSKRPVC